MTKFDKLMKVYQELMLEFKELDSDLITNILDSWSTSFSQMEQYLENKQIRKSQMNSGLQQGLKELPDLLSDLPDKEREIALLKLYKVMNKNIPDFYYSTHNKAVNGKRYPIKLLSEIYLIQSTF
tara:strand:+ start:148 stop:522 length:375 start_codon:yes stop_codon:yes gene_type:complete